MRTAVIVGGSGGIGREVINMLLKNEINVINIDKVQNITNKVKNIVCELDRNNAFSTINEICEQTPKIDFFISTIGYYEARTIDTITKDYLNKMLDVNLFIPTVFAQEIYKKMNSWNQGKIVIILSAAAYIGSRDLAYSISKAGELGLIRGIAKSTKKSNVCIYGIAPGIVKTTMSAGMSLERQNDAVSGTSMGRMCEPIEIANLIEYVLFKDLGYMSGSVIHINDGLYLN